MRALRLSGMAWGCRGTAFAARAGMRALRTNPHAPDRKTARMQGGEPSCRKMRKNRKLPIDFCVKCCIIINVRLRGMV